MAGKCIRSWFRALHTLAFAEVATDTFGKIWKKRPAFNLIARFNRLVRLDREVIHRGYVRVIGYILGGL